MEKKQLHIAVGIIRNTKQEIFITQRAANSHMGGFWEFPGGKLEIGETPVEALLRELKEEIGIDVINSQLLQVVEHEFPDRRITLHFFLVEQWDCQPYGKEGQSSRWLLQKSLVAEEFPPANRVIVDMLINNVI
ncbi:MULTISPECIES: 8-oxo-dGTP diphosphatase MutT [unclassified Arsenophonus]|uniref:8-oxo-dGTP diphosphatase MutT n=1 Tax=unclassified Arsenophonus TaxID=2627083 RepID=UPI00285BCCFB|nr:8-oxo-dGTP diphosphatase MutT [Arsenophonus sp.]MDR5609558.1 8-oxo-dGTP diphosphatase MutT [Arsenophonus sp.]MDR5613288.1 8-oxo-dGTP diphosphatase MutT [Arsenophonus sp.]MDR5617611.1 8-oxo-dGTP diphosphatase MutT [Arsenophonus sp.]